MGILCDIYIYIYTHILQLEQLVEALLTLMIEVRPPVLKSPFQSDSLILLCNPDGEPSPKLQQQAVYFFCRQN